MAEITILDEPDRAVFRDSKILSCNRAKPSSECGCASVCVCVCFALEEESNWSENWASTRAMHREHNEKPLTLALIRSRLLSRSAPEIYGRFMPS